MAYVAATSRLKRPQAATNDALHRYCVAATLGVSCNLTVARAATLHYEVTTWQLLRVLVQH